MLAFAGDRFLGGEPFVGLELLTAFSTEPVAGKGNIAAFRTDSYPGPAVLAELLPLGIEALAIGTLHRLPLTARD